MSLTKKKAKKKEKDFRLPEDEMDNCLYLLDLIKKFNSKAC